MSVIIIFYILHTLRIPPFFLQNEKSATELLNNFNIRTLENENNFLDYKTKLQKVINIWEMRNLSLLGKITIFKTLALSKIIHQALVTNVPTATIEILSKIQKEFFWGKNKSKIKHDTLCNGYENGGLKGVDIFSK